MNKSNNITILLFSCLLLLASCQSSKKKLNYYDWNNGSVTITADSNLRFVLEQLVPVYENFHPKASVNFNFTSEDKAIHDFKTKANTIIVVERQLSKDEMQSATLHQDAKIIENIFAYDAIAVIANKSYTDSVFDINKTAQYLQSASTTKLVFDNAQSGIAKTILQLSGVPAADFKNAYALNNIADVLKYVAENKNTIGFIPYNLLSNRNEQEAKYIRSTYKFLAVAYKNNTIALSQENIANQKYPLIRPIVMYIGNCPEVVGQGFANFLFERQISKALLLSGLIPMSIPAREVVVTEEFHPSK